MSVRIRPVPFARRAISALLVGLWLVGLVGSLFHGTSHEHTYCSQHKTFEEVGTASGTDVREDASVRSGVAPVYQHQACAFADMGVRAPLPDAFTIDVVRPTPPAPAPAPLLAHVAFQIPLLANAPKSSPPALVVCDS